MTESKLKADQVGIIAMMRDVTVTYDGYMTRALARVNLDVRRGEVLGVLGPKGAGKSTVLKILAGRMSPTEGKAKVFGGSPRRGGAKARVGYLSEAADSGKPQGFFGRFFGGESASPSTSKGNARLTQAVLGNRDLLVLDEPFAGLDAAEKTEAAGLVRELAGRGKTVIISSDALMDIKDLCHRLVIFHEGKVQAVGTLAELLTMGAAARFLPAILPRETVERVLKVLREEILGGAAVSQTSPAPQEGSADIPEEIKANAKPNDSIDHEKLEGLARPGKSE
jgi:ABC-2 type transport system ATP-binding protein